MDFLTNLLGDTAAVVIPLVAAILGLFLAWIGGRLGAFIVRKIFERAQVDERVSKSLDTKTQITKWVSGFTFWALFIFIIIWLVDFAQGMGWLPSNLAASPEQTLFLNTVLGRIFSVAISLLVAWIVATALKFLVIRVLNVTRLDERLGEKVTGKKAASNMNESIGKAVFWLVFLVFIPSILSNLEMGEVASSVQGLVDQMLAFIPGVIGATIIILLGGMLARIIRQIVTGFLEGLGVDKFGERVGLSTAQNAQPLSSLIGMVVYLLIIIPVVVQALAVLDLPVITSIGTRLLDGVTGAILGTLGAAVILGVAYYLAKFISEIVTNLLAGIGLDRLPEALGFKTAKGANLSSVVGYVVMVYVMLFAVQGTAETFGLASIAGIVGSLIALGGNVLLGIVIFLAGVYLANVASNVITTAGGSDAAFLANIARWAILIFVAGIALSQAGVTLAENAITVILYAVGATFALAFGLGGRDAAAKQVEKWFNRKSK
ncbi:MAG TPA: mechanosensitive ion channel [Anaerolineales bacterium]|nr:mechanosensitive ion channel [Anaerolineales bacterium]